MNMPLQPRPASAVPSASAPPPAIALITALVEALAGRRPLRPHLSREAFLAVVDYADEGTFARTTVAGLRTQMPSERAVEASLRLLTASRWVSCVLRLDRTDRAWRCTEVSVLAPSALLGR